MKAISLTSVVVVVAVMVVQLHQSEAGNDIVSVSKFKKFAVAKEIKDWIRSTGVIPDDICKQIVEASLGPNYSDTVGELTSVKQIDKTVSWQYHSFHVNTQCDVMKRKEKIM